MGTSDMEIKKVLQTLKRLQLQFKLRIPFGSEQIAKGIQQKLAEEQITAEVDYEVHTNTYDLVIL